MAKRLTYSRVRVCEGFAHSLGASAYSTSSLGETSLGDERLPLARPGSSLKRLQRPYLDFVGGTGEDRIE
jgi:hypothetical protein